MSVLFDTLNHPEADTGREKKSLLEWRFRPDLSVDHMVIGRGRPGGCWEALEGTVQTVSLGNWMELPNLKMRSQSSSESRVSVSDVADYYGVINDNTF